MSRLSIQQAASTLTSITVLQTIAKPDHMANALLKKRKKLDPNTPYQTQPEHNTIVHKHC